MKPHGMTAALVQQGVEGKKMIRKPIITVLGHVDHGKTSFLDKIRGTAVTEQEAGAITQHIGATEVPFEVIKKIAGEMIQKYGFKISLPGLLFIDTPGHEAFTNLRERGGSIADLAVLVIDLEQGMQPQTMESIEILKNFKVPFVVVLTKLDKLHSWNSIEGTVSANMKTQLTEAVGELDEKIYKIVGDIYKKGFVAERFDRVKDFTKEIPVIPVSNKTGEGIPEVLMFLAGLSQKYLEKRLKIQVKGPGKGTVLEVKEEKGLGKTVDVILYDGVVKIGEEIVLGGKNGIIRTKVRALLQPKPLDEIRAPQERFKNAREVHAAAGLKIAAPGLEDALAGMPLSVVETGKETEEIRKIIERIRIDTETAGVTVKADALGSLEALIKLFEKNGVKIRKADIGEVTRRDVMEAESVKEKEPLKAVVIAFNSKVKGDAKEKADKKGIKIFEGKVVYRLLEEYQEWETGKKNEEKMKKLGELVFPARIKIMPNHTFRHSRPAIVGVKVVEGKLKNGVKLMKKGKKAGTVSGIQSKGESIKEAKKDEEVAISIDGATVGRNIEEKDELLTFIPKKEILKLEKESCLLSEEEKGLLQEIKKIGEKMEE